MISALVYNYYKTIDENSLRYVVHILLENTDAIYVNRQQISLNLKF